MRRINITKLLLGFLGLLIFNSYNLIAQPCVGSVSFTINPQPTGGGYAPGTVVTYCYTINNYSQAGVNWFEGFSIQLGAGWLPGSITPVTPPGNLNGGGGTWIWVANTFNVPPPNVGTVGPGYFFDLNNNGIPWDDFGDAGAGPWTMCFSVTVGNTAGASLGVGVAPVSDGFAGSWGSNACDGLVFTPVTPNNIIVLGCGSLIPSVTNQVNVLCNGGNNGSFSISTANGNPPFTFSFMGGAYGATNSFSNLTAGTYNVVIQDANNCTVPFPVTITQPPVPLSVTLIFKNNVGCAGGATGNYRIIGSGGTGPYTYSTDGVNFVPPNNGTSFQTNSLSVGTYDVYVKDANGCTATLSIVINEPLPLTGNITAQTNAPCTGPGTGSVTIVGVDGTPVYQYKLGTGAYQLSGTFNNLAPGTYTVTIKDANNCTATVQVTILQPSTPTGSVLSQTDVDCFGNATGVFNFDGANGAAPYTFSIGGGAFASNPFNGIAAGNYTITVQEANGCTGTFNATMNQPNALNLAIASQVNIDCFGASTGEVTLNATDGTAPYTYSFNGTTNSTGIFTGLSAGNNSFDVTDANGCTANVVANITQPATGVGALIVVQNNVLCTGTSTGSFTLQGNNGNAPYSFTLNGVTNSTGTFNNLPAAVYNVTVTDATGCTFIQNVNLISPNALTASITAQTAVNCFGGNNASVTVTAASGTNPYTYTLGASTNSTGVFNGLSAGNFNVIVTDQNGCTFTQPVSIIQPSAALSSSITNQTNVACFGGNDGAVTVLASNGTGPYSYTLGANNNNTGQFTNLISGNYSVQVTDNNGCTLNQNVNITQPLGALGGSTLSQIAVDCFGNNTGQIQVSGTNGTAPYGYVLGATNNTTGNFSNLTAGNYNITITDNNACTFVYPIVITQPAAALSASIANQTDAICFNGSNGTVTLSATDGTPGYQYGLTGTALSNSPLITGLAAGNYTVVIQDNNACTVSLNVVIGQPAVPVSVQVTSTIDVLCFGNNTGALTALASDGIAPYTYTVGPNSNTTGVFNSLLAGSYTINVSDNNGCVANTNVNINQPSSALIVTIANATNPVCNGYNNGSATALASGGTAALLYNYTWNTLPVQNSSQANNLIAGNYTVTVTDDNLCTASTNVTLTEPNFQLDVPSSITICDGQQAVMSATSLDGASPVIYSWTNTTDGTVIIGNTVSPSPNSNVNFSVVATDANGCQTAPSVVNVNVNPTPVAAFTEDTHEGCQTLCVAFNATPTLPNSNWQWDFGDAQTALGQNPVNCFKEEGIYTVSLTAISDLGCTHTIQKSDLITVYQIPKAIFTLEPAETTLSNPTISVSNQSAGAEEFLWNFGDKTTSDQFSPNHTYLETGNYCVWLTVKNNFGCVDSTKECVKIKPNHTLFIPSSFTPNGDNLNDVFIPLAQSVKEFEMNIYNRWGLKVFTSHELEIGWDGGSEPQGAFNYVIQVTTQTGEQKIYTGSVTLYR
ncbi:MAG TPA: PKD domain-containing protein [Bacteroidia bacterium]|nr:PKD domain-containing protein [Bacteroidia bacterium]